MNYFSKVENKYVFNFSLIFWHAFIVLSSIVIVVSLVVFLWSIFPPFEKNVEKQAYPEKNSYPEPVKVQLSDLKLEDVVPVEVPPPPIEESNEKVKRPAPKAHEDTRGKEDYEVSLNNLKKLIPPSKYSWSGSGYWSYPYGERYWTYYKKEEYRQWNVSEAGVEDKLKFSFDYSKAKSFSEKKQLLDSYISILKYIKEENRLDALQIILNNISNNLTKNVNSCQAISAVVSKMKDGGNSDYISTLLVFCNDNPNDGIPFVNYISSIIEKFNPNQRNEIIGNLKNSYYRFFNDDLNKQKEATDLFIPMLGQIDVENQNKYLLMYYKIFEEKNAQRNNSIAQIEFEYDLKVKEIDEKFEKEKYDAKELYLKKKFSKQEYLIKSLTGLGAGIILIVLIATILVFLSIQRSVRKIEEKISRKELE